MGESDRKVSIRTGDCYAEGIALVPITAQLEGIEWIVLLILIAVFVLWVWSISRWLARHRVR